MLEIGHGWEGRGRERHVGARKVCKKSAGGKGASGREVGMRGTDMMGHERL